MPEMRSREGKVYDVSEEDAATLARDQGFVPNEPEAEPERSVTLKSKQGKLYQASPEEAAVLERDQGMTPASEEETSARMRQRELYGKYGPTGQQALGLAEAFYRNASLGVIKGLIGDEQEQRERAEVTKQESPVLYGAAGLAPGVAAGLATGGAGLGAVGTIGAEGLIGGAANYASESDAAFVEDRALSAEQAWGAFGKGALLGAGTAGAFMAAGAVTAPLRNRFAEAAGRAERRAERAAFRSVGIDEPVPGLADAVVKPAKAAAMRERGRAAAIQVREEFGGALERLEGVEQAARRWTPEATDVAGDAAAQRAAIRAPLDALRKDLEPIASADEKGLVSRAFAAIDRAETPDQLYTAVRLSKQAFSDGLGAASDAATARALERGVKRLDELENNSALFGPPAQKGAERAQALSDLSDARQQLTDYLGSHNYLEVTGMRAGKDIDDALDSYVDKLGKVIQLSKGMPEAKEAKQALAQLQKLREGPLREVAALNQADAVSALDPQSVRPRGPSGTAAILDGAELAAKMAAAPGYSAWKVAKVAWTARKLAAAAPEQRVKLAGKLALDLASFADPMVSPLKLAYKYRHHIAVLAETAREEAAAAAKQIVGTVEQEGVEGIAKKAARAFDREKQVSELISKAKSLRSQRGATGAEAAAAAAGVGGAALGARSLAARFSDEQFGEQEYSEIRKVIETLQKDPGLLAEKLAGELGELPNEAPDLVMDLNALGAKAVQILSSKLPPSAGFALLYPDGPPPSKSDVVDMSLHLRGITRPSEVIEAMGNGSAMPEEIDTFRAMYPRRFALLQQAVHTEIAVANQEGRVIPAQRIATIESLLDLPGQLDPTFSDDVAAIAQSVHAEAMQARAASYVPPPRAGNRIQPSTESETT